MPSWLARRLERQGYIDPDTGATGNARLTTCRSCHRNVVVGFDGDPRRRHGGYMARLVDPQPLTSFGEAQALLDYRNTFNLRWAGDHYELRGPRDQFMVRSVPAQNTQQIDVVVEHDCHRSDLLLPYLPRSNIPDPTSVDLDPTEPPY